MQETVINLRQILHTSVLCQFLAQVSGTSFSSVCRCYYLHNHLQFGGAAGADGQLMCGQWDTRS